MIRASAGRRSTRSRAQQQQAEQEAAAREAVTGEVVRLASSIAACATTMEAVRAETSANEPRLASLEHRAELTEQQASSDREATSRRPQEKVDSQRVDQLTKDVAESTDSSHRRISKLDAEIRHATMELMKALELRMPREDAQRAFDAIAEQLNRQERAPRPTSGSLT